MITEVTPTQCSQSREVRHKYREPWDPDYTPADFGKPVDLIPDKNVRLTLALDIMYDHDQGHKKLVKDLLDAVRAIQEAVAK